MDNPVVVNDKQRRNRKNFFLVDNEIFRYKLKPVAFYVYCYLRRCDNARRGCYPSKRTIANACGIAVSSVSGALKLLAERGLITCRHNYRGGRQINNSYAFLPVSPEAPPMCHSDICPVSQADRNNKTNRTTQYKEDLNGREKK